MSAARKGLATVLAGACLFLLAGGGCSTPGGSFTIFPTGDFLLKSTKFVRRGVPRQMPIARELEKTVIPEYVLQPGDALLVEPVSLDSPIRLPADQTIMPDGTIDLGRYGRPIVAGKTVEQVEEEVTSAVRAVETRPVETINVRLVNAESAVYYVLGEVSSPGSFSFLGRETVLDAILTAGGLSDKASPCTIILSRPTSPDGCRIVLPVCYRQIVQLGDTSTNYQIMPGDRVYVATRTFGETCFNKRACPLCQGVQCPCPATSALVPALPRITPPRVIDATERLPASAETLDLPAAPAEMPAAPPDDAPQTLYDSAPLMPRAKGVVLR
jgi:protein involved in polysaccharide export with SLBB domain